MTDHIHNFVLAEFVNNRIPKESTWVCVCGAWCYVGHPNESFIEQETK